MRSYEIGLSALRATQVRIATHGNNIANAATPGYARQVVDLAERPQLEYQNLLVGSGVDATQIRSLRDAAAEAGLSRNSSLTGSLEAQLDSAGSLESLLTPSDSSIHTYVSDVFNNLERVANAPEESTARAEFVRVAESLVSEGAFISSSLDDIQLEARRDHATGVETANTLIHEIAGLNGQIWASHTAGEEPHSLLAQRDGAISRLSEWIDVNVSTLANGADVVMLGGGSASFSTEAVTLASEIGTDGDLTITVDPGREVTPGGGNLEGLQIVHNSSFVEAREEIETLVGEVVRQLDQIHATGISNPDGFQALTSTRGPRQTNVALVDAGLAFPVTAGEIFVTVTDQSTGARTTTRLEIAPESTTLENVANRLSQLDNLNAVIAGGSNQLVIQASDGFSFDFAGRPDNVGALTSFAGTSEVRFSGAYTPTNTIEAAFETSTSSTSVNQRLSISLPEAGQIGVTPGLLAEVRDQSGTLIQTISVGADYTVGEPVSLQNGMYVAFGEGTVVSGDEVGVNAIASADTTGLLSALGVNSLFTGSSLDTFHVRSDIQENPFLFSASLTGEIGDAGNAARMASVRDHRFDSLDGRTFVETMADLTASAGLDVQQLKNDVSRLEAYRSQLQSSRDSASGVDTNEELLELLAAERAFQAAARFVATFDDTMVELLGLVG